MPSCRCAGCSNHRENFNTVLVPSIHKTLQRNSTAWKPRITPNPDPSPTDSLLPSGHSHSPAVAAHIKGCKCKRSKCLKNYCECHQARIRCSDICQCIGCLNV